MGVVGGRSISTQCNAQTSTQVNEKKRERETTPSEVCTESAQNSCQALVAHDDRSSAAKKGKGRVLVVGVDKKWRNDRRRARATREVQS